MGPGLITDIITVDDELYPVTGRTTIIMTDDGRERLVIPAQIPPQLTVGMEPEAVGIDLTADIKKPAIRVTVNGTGVKDHAILLPAVHLSTIGDGVAIGILDIWVGPMNRLFTIL